jgi:ABC-type phosphate transport system permease subunit
MNRTWYRVLWFLELVVILVIALVLILPIQDYALREFKEWQLHPSPETLTAFQQKSHEESQLRMIIAGSLAVAAVILAIPIVRFRSKSRKPN